jgi:hypothetical protein
LKKLETDYFKTFALEEEESWCVYLVFIGREIVIASDCRCWSCRSWLAERSTVKKNVEMLEIHFSIFCFYEISIPNVSPGQPFSVYLCEQVNICVLLLLWSALEETPYKSFIMIWNQIPVNLLPQTSKMIPQNSFNRFTLEEKQKLLLELRLGRVLVDGECWCEPNENNFSILSQCLYPCILSSAFSTFNT